MMKPISERGIGAPFTKFTTLIESHAKQANTSAISGEKPPSKGFRPANTACPSQSRITTPSPTAPREASIAASEFTL
ncbi:hypothetical protein ACOSP7_030994 [Xanthoceras sorbifolium]